MARPFVFPSPNDRTPNDPSTIVNSAGVIGLYNQESGDPDKMERVTAKVQDWFTKRAKETYAWDDAVFSGSQCVLKVDMPVRQIGGEK